MRHLDSAPVRVLCIGNMYPPHHFGGYEQVWSSAVAHLRDRGHQVHVVTTTFRHSGVPDGEEPAVHRELLWYWQDHEFKRFPLLERVRIERHNHGLLNDALDQLRPDIVSFWSMGGMSHSLIEAVRRRGIPAVAFVHDGWLVYGRETDQWSRIFRHGRWRLLQPLKALTGIPADVHYEGAARYVFVSEFMRRATLGTGLDLHDTAVAHSGINPVFLSPGPVSDWRGRLLYVGRLHPDKGINDAVDALAHLPDATLTFAGSWDARDERALETQIAERALGDRVQLLGQRIREEVIALYHDADAVLFPARWEEPWGLVPIEAMACGCPVIATGRGGSKEYLRADENCILVPDRNPDALAAAVRRLAASPALRARLRGGGLETAPLHTETIFNQAVERHLGEVAGSADEERRGRSSGRAGERHPTTQVPERLAQQGPLG